MYRPYAEEESFYLVYMLLYRLSQEAGRRIVELNEVINSLSVLVKEKEEQLSQHKNAFSRKEKVTVHSGQTFNMWNCLGQKTTNQVIAGPRWCKKRRD